MPFVELPAIYLDNVEMDDVIAGIALINLEPDDGESGVLVNTNITIEIADLSGVGLDAAETQVFVNINGQGELIALNGAVFQPGFTGIDSAISSPDPDTTRIVIDPIAPFSSLDSVTVRVVAETTGGGNTLDQSYTFTVQDISPPAVLAASARDLDVVRVTFDEPVKQVSPSDLDDALNPANYSFTPEPDQLPAVTAVGKLVEAVNATTVDVTTDIELSMSKNYKVTVSGVADLDGNIS